MEDKNNYNDPDISNTSTEIYFYDLYGTHFHLYHYSSSYIRLWVFLITSFCVGLPALVWTFHLLYLHTKIREQVSSFMLLLLLSDLIQLLLNLYIVTKLLTNLYWTPEVFQFWSGLHVSGFHLHQLVALEGVLTLKYPLCFTRICSMPCYIIISIIVLLFSIQSAFMFWMDSFVNMPILFFNIGTSVASLNYLAVAFTITCTASSTPVSKYTRSVLTVAIFTFIMLYLPSLLYIFVNFYMGGVHISWYVMSVCLMSLRVISDPVLCVLVCRGNLRHVQTPQTHSETNADQTSVSSVIRTVFFI